MSADGAELTEVKEESIKVLSKRHESALIIEQSKLIDLQTLLDSREEAGYFLSATLFAVAWADEDWTSPVRGSTGWCLCVWSGPVGSSECRYFFPTRTFRTFRSEKWLMKKKAYHKCFAEASFYVARNFVSPCIVTCDV